MLQTSAVATALRLQPRQRQLHPGQGPEQVDLDAVWRC